MEMKRRTSRGFTTVELITAATVGLMATAILAETSILAARTFQKVGDVAKAHTFGRRAFDQFVADVQGADMSMAKFPAWTSTPWFTAAENQCVILRKPVFKADKTVDPKNFKVITYRLVAATVPADGPFVLKRTVSPLMIDPGVTSSASMGTTTIVAKNIKSVKWNQMTNQTFWGDQYTTDYYLISAPQADTAQIKLKALIGGVDRLTDGHATIAGNKVTIFKPLQYGVAMDVSYHTDPAYPLDYTANNGATAMFVNFVFQPRWTSTSGAEQRRDVALSAMPQLENKVD